MPGAGKADQARRFLGIARHQPAFEGEPAQRFLGARGVRTPQQLHRTLGIGEPPSLAISISASAASQSMAAGAREEAGSFGGVAMSVPGIAAGSPRTHWSPLRLLSFKAGMLWQSG
jgi:hypothetical protein